MHRFFKKLAHTSAIIGGIVLVFLIILSTLSIAGRSLNKLLHSDVAQSVFGAFSQKLLDLGLGEIQGNYELLEAGVAFSIFAFLPVCQFHRAHATVDFFTASMSGKPLRYLQAFWEIILSAVILFITWRLYEGLQRYIGNGETTFFLQMPIWWSYLASFLAACIACIIAIYCAVIRALEAFTGRALLPGTQS